MSASWVPGLPASHCWRLVHPKPMGAGTDWDCKHHHAPAQVLMGRHALRMRSWRMPLPVVRLVKGAGSLQDWHLGKWALITASDPLSSNHDVALRSLRLQSVCESLR